MSEFKKGDILVNKTAVNTGTIELIYEQKYYFHGLSKDFGIITISKKKLAKYRKANKAEEEAGKRLDDIKIEVTYGIKLNDLGVVAMGFDLGRDITHDLGDDSPIENHISPNCKVEDV